MSPQKEYPGILQLPVELLIEIFSYITDHRYIPFVCHRFYQIICLMERHFCILSIKDERTVSRTIMMNYKLISLCHTITVAKE